MVIGDVHIPEYLRGQIRDVRREPDGTVSFVDNSGGTGGNSLESSRERLDDSMTRATFDPVYRAANPDAVAVGQYNPPVQRSLGESLKRGVAGKLRDIGDGMTGSFWKNTAATGLLSALAGGAGGAWLANKTGEPMLDKAVLFALLGGGLGTGIGALVNHHSNKFVQNFDNDYGLQKQSSIAGALMFDPTLTDRQKMILAEAITRLPQQEKRELDSILAQVTGAGVGVLIAKFLGLRGVLAPSLLALFGLGVSSAMTSPRRSYNILGSPITS